MALHADIPGVAMQLSRGIVVASIQVDLDDDVLARFREDLLARLHESGSRGSSSTCRACRRSIPRNSPPCAAS